MPPATFVPPSAPVLSISTPYYTRNSLGLNKWHPTAAGSGHKLGYGNKLWAEQSRPTCTWCTLKIPCSSRIPPWKFTAILGINTPLIPCGKIGQNGLACRVEWLTINNNILLKKLNHSWPPQGKPSKLPVGQVFTRDDRAMLTLSVPTALVRSSSWHQPFFSEWYQTDSHHL